MHFNDGGYSRRQYNTDLLRSTATMVAREIPRLLQEHNADAVAVTGKSGLSLAFAALMLADFKIIVIRKRGENSHGNPIEGSPGNVSRYIILDDFISEGGTVREIVRRLEEYAQQQGGQPAHCAGVYQYGERYRTDTGDVLTLDAEHQAFVDIL